MPKQRRDRKTKKAYAQVSAGAYHTCRLLTNSVVGCWGYNAFGQATPPGGTFSQVSAGGNHTCGLHTGGYWTCWGANGYGQLNGLRVSLPLLARDVSSR
jgi:alpha-tubulin suppressor-like RCC1 family protein